MMIFPSFGRSCEESSCSTVFVTTVKQLKETENVYIIRCLLLKHRLTFLLVFLYLTRLKARQTLSRLTKFEDDRVKI